MSSACPHQPRSEHVVVITRNGNYSAFNGYRFAASDYSQVRCVTCGASWRTKARWVAGCRDAADDRERFGVIGETR